MHFRTCLIPATLATCIVLLAPSLTRGQAAGVDQNLAAAEIPEAPQPAAGLSTSTDRTASDQAPSSSVTGSSSAQTGAQQPKQEKSKPLTAAEQLKQQEHQRVMGVMATFNTTLNKDALPLSPKQKFQLFFRSATDPWPFLLNGFVAGIGQAKDSNPDWGQGMQGYAKRFGSGYSDYFIGNFFGNALLPSLLHEDPRYFQKGTGSVGSRILWAAGGSVWCKRDKGGWGPNYANVAGNLIGTAIARVYYPPEDRNVQDTVMDGLTVTAEGAIGSELIEFWPDIARHYKRKHAEKLARQEAQRLAQNTGRLGSQQTPAAPAKNP
jgi:hypothetical protein